MPKLVAAYVRQLALSTQRCAAIDAQCLLLPAFAQAHPGVQPDAE